MYGDIKTQILDLFPFSYDATLIVLGLLIWLITGLVFRLPMTRLVCIAPIVILAVAIEIADVIFLSQAPVRAISDFAFLVVPVAILVLFQHNGWARA
jgi:fucose 4-O-acetylase-like acetyltransferase